MNTKTLTFVHIAVFCGLLGGAVYVVRQAANQPTQTRQITRPTARLVPTQSTQQIEEQERNRRIQRYQQEDALIRARLQAQDDLENGILGNEAIPEPTLPAFSFYQSYPLEAVPAHSPCRWVDVGRYEHRYVPVLFQRRHTIVASELAHCHYPAEHRWSTVLRWRLERMVQTPLHYTEYGPDGNLAIMAAYGILDLPPMMDHSHNPEDTTDLRTHVLPQIYRSPTRLETAYNWAMPRLIQTWRRMPAEMRTNYTRILVSGQTYLSTFDRTGEDTYLHDLTQGHCTHPRDDQESVQWVSSMNRGPFRNGRCTGDFTSHARGETNENPFRKFHAFLYRRAVDGVPVPLMRHYLDRVVAALNAPPSS